MEEIKVYGFQEEIDPCAVDCEKYYEYWGYEIDGCGWYVSPKTTSWF